jgi:hypothetical protein
MAGTKQGGIKAAATNRVRYGEDFYINLGHKGGTAPSAPKGFAYTAIHDPERLSQISRKRWEERNATIDNQG